MKIKLNNSMILSFAAITSLILVLNFFSVLLYQPTVLAENNNNDFGFEKEHILIKKSFYKPSFFKHNLKNKTFTSFSMKGTLSIGSEPGSPIFPVIPIQILIPYGKQIDEINIIPYLSQEINLKDINVNLIEDPIVPYQPPIPIGTPLPSTYFYNEEIYQSCIELPDKIYESLGINFCKGYSILTLNIYPTKYNPINGQMSYYNDIIIDIELKDLNQPNLMLRNNVNDRNWVKSIVENSEDIESYDNVNYDKSEKYIGGLCDNTESVDYVIITKEFLADYSAEYTWDDFIYRKQLNNWNNNVKIKT